MKRFIYVAGAAGMMWALPAHAVTDAATTGSTAAKPRDAVRSALADRAVVPPDAAPRANGRDQKDTDGKVSDTGRRGKDTKGKDSHDRISGAKAVDAAHADASKRHDQATHEGRQLAHDRATSHAATDASASHVDAANRAAVHSASGAQSQAASDAHDAAGQMRTRIEHGDTRGMEGEGGGGEGGGTGTHGGTSGATGSQTFNPGH